MITDQCITCSKPKGEHPRKGCEGYMSWEDVRERIRSYPDNQERKNK